MFVRLTGPAGAPGKSGGGLPAVWGFDGDITAPADGFDISNYGRTGEAGEDVVPTDGDWFIDSVPALYQVRGGAPVRITTLPAGAPGDPGPAGGQNTDPHNHLVDVGTHTYADLANGYTDPVALTTVIAGRR